MKIAHLSLSDHAGGAAIAASRIHRALLEAGVDSRMFVSDLPTHRNSVSFATPGQALLGKLGVDMRLTEALFDDSLFRSAAIVRTRAVKLIKEWQPDAVNLHWVSQRTASIAQIGDLMKSFPTVWSLHDMWPFTGIEHYSPQSLESRWWAGGETRRPTNLGETLDSWVFARKKKYWTKEGDAVTPGRWLSCLGKESVLFENWRFHEIPYPSHTEPFSANSVEEFRRRIGVETHIPIVAFGAHNWFFDHRKGWLLLEEALRVLWDRGKLFHLIVFGASGSGKIDSAPFPLTELGPVSSEKALSEIFHLADVLAVPSTADNFPLVALDAQASGTPVVAFDVSGMRDVVPHPQLGYLATAFDPFDFSIGIEKMMESKTGPQFSQKLMDYTREKSSPEKVAEAYKDVYVSAVNGLTSDHLRE